MTMRTSEPLICECGHEGSLDCRENDAPFSKMWEEYTLDGFSGDSLVLTSNKDRPADLLGHLKPTCPQCGQTGKVKYK